MNTACAKLADLEEMAKEIDSKATSHEIKQLAQQQAALAQSVNGMAEWLAVRPDPDGNKGPPSLTKFKCVKGGVWRGWWPAAVWEGE